MPGKLALLFVLTALSPSVLAQESPSVQLLGDEAQEAELVVEDSDSSIEIEAAQLQLITNVEVASRAAGAIEKVSVKEGDKVSAGDSLVKLDDEEACATAKSARSELEISQEETKNEVDEKYAKASMEVSGKVYQRSLNATKQYAKSVSKTELERLKLEYERAKLSGEQAEMKSAINELKVDQMKAQLDLACVQLKNREIQSPVSGTVVQVYRQNGEWVQPGQPVARIIDLTKLRVSCRCYLEDASPDEIDEEATFIYEDKEYKAAVVFASPEIDPDLQDFSVWAEVENPDGTLKPGMSGNIVLQKKAK